MDSGHKPDFFDLTFEREMTMKRIEIAGVALLAALTLTACGGGGGSDDPAPAPSQDQNQGGDGSGEPADGTVEVVPGVDQADVTTPDDIIMLAPGILFEDSYYDRIQRQANRANTSASGDMTGEDRIVASGACPSGAGTVEVVGDLTLHYPGNPYTGAQFDEARINYLNCEGVNWGDDVVNGRINISYPTTGIGSGDFDNELDFVVSEQFGHDDANPVVIQGPAQADGVWTASGMAHGHIMRANSAEGWGYDGAKFTVNLKTTVEDFYGEDLTRIQWGNPVEDFTYEASAFTGTSVRSYEENYIGYYAKVVEKIGGEAVPATCTQGGVNVQTTTPLSISHPQLDPSDKTILSGVIQVEYGVDGKVATLTYDGANVTVSMDNGSTTQVYTYAEAENVRTTNCGF